MPITLRDVYEEGESTAGWAEREGGTRDEGAQNASGHATTPAGGESGGRPHGRLGGGRSRTGLDTVANDP